MTNCFSCTHIKTHNNGKRMLKQGFSGCTKRPAWEYMPIDVQHKCAEYERAAADVLQKREAWNK